MSDQPTALDLPMADLPPETLRYFEVCREKLGLVPNVLRAYAHDVEKLNAFIAMYNVLMLGPSGLSKLEREMIAVAVSAENDCWYCQVAHGAAVRSLSGKPELGEALVMNAHVAPLAPRERAMIDFARKMCHESSAISEADRDALRAHGLSDADIWDVINVAGFFSMSNRVASASGLQPNPEYHAQGR
ncbi:peroxidase-related enzyme [Oceanibium sediminis]|uniref:peroxidase-related enzyme n=1 Tax=Oceanibium sediminis TaxID=2026339 RepID=UPI000DD2CF45|nr:peroxidase-related enzyme [Oceanibium sediminis]